MEALRRIETVRDRLYSENRMSGDEMRNSAQALDVAVAILTEPGRTPEDARDIIIRTLTAEVEHLIEDVIPALMAGYPLNAPERADARTHRAAARALLARLEARP